jgi:hypothetical protein
MATLVGRITREVYRRELLPARARWWLAAEGMRDWYRVLGSRLRPHVEDSRGLLARLSVRMFERRYDALREAHPSARLPSPSPRVVLDTMSALYRVDRASTSAWIFDGGDARLPRRARVTDRVRAHRLLAPLDPDARWREVTAHLGELLIVLTEDLPAHLPHARKILGDICFAAGVRFAERVKKTMGIPDAPPDAPAAAMEVLRMSEYVFRVNPEHWGETDAVARTGFLEGTACPWFMRPGWNGAHCGIFGQFQSGIASVFDLRYLLSKTIPKHGGHTCRIDLKPLATPPEGRDAVVVQLRVPRR